MLVHASARLLFLPSLNDFHYLERRLYITGHSLGGGLAKLVAANVSIQAGKGDPSCILGVNSFKTIGLAAFIFPLLATADLLSCMDRITS